MDKALQGKVVLVTGGSTGIGLGTAKCMVEASAFVFITGRRQAELDAAIAELGPSAAAVQTESTKLDELDRLFATIKAQKGRLDAIFVNAGGGARTMLTDITEADYARTFDLNVKGLIFTVQKALPLLSDGGSIILNASIAGTKGNPGLSLYGASKAAVRALVRSWILELKDRQIRVNVISPGPIETPGMYGALGNEDLKAKMAMMAEGVPAGRLGRPEEIGAAAVFLASDASSFVNGVDLAVDGGTAQV